MNKLIKIGKHEITTKEFNGNRVVTFKDIDLVHERPEGTARRTFNVNKGRLTEGRDYFERNSYEAKEEHGIVAPNGLILITERGYLMLVKSFTDDLAWEVQGQLVDTYFRSIKPMSPLEQLKLQHDAIIEVNEKVEEVRTELEEFKNDMPLLAVEMERITVAKNVKVVPLLGGKNATAYKDKPIRTRVYKDLESQLWRQFGVKSYKAIKRIQCDLAVEIINRYELPLVLRQEIENCNGQYALG